ncbi:MAG: hypothetical protein E7353_02320 [Clostridiales bacterium]|nr:hypothetical protein [Clostridiales bacterium]
MKANEAKNEQYNSIMDLFNSVIKTNRAKNSSVNNQVESKSQDDQTNTSCVGTIDISDGFQLDLNGIDLFDSVADTDTTCEHASDGLIHSLNAFGRVDVEYIASLTGKSVKDVIYELRGAIFQNPEKFDGSLVSGWETADEYLSGNLSEKLRTAIKYNCDYNGYFNVNVNAIKSVMPQNTDLKKIYVTLGTPWLPTSLVERFIRELLRCASKGFLVHDDYTGSWEIKNKSLVRYDSDFTRTNITYGTNKMDALNIIEHTLNMQSVKVTEETRSYFGKKKYVVDEKATMLALEKQRKIVSAFENWIHKSDDRYKELQKIYEDKFCCIRTRKYDGSFLTLPNKSEDIELYPYQKNAVARILFSPNTLLAHDVGAGKTYIMIASGMELKRMGISKKNMYVVPNNIIEQWNIAFKTMYPHSNVLCISPNKFTPKKRQAVLESIRDNDYDAIIIASSCFSMIPMSLKFIEEDYGKQLDNLKKSVQSSNLTRKVKNRMESLKKELQKIQLDILHNGGLGVTFDQLGINTLFVDEAHNFKNVPFDTQTNGIYGINAIGSQKCKDMFNKVKHVQETNNGRGVVFATGTPVTNSLSDLYIIQKYLQSGVLESLNIASFDAWIANYAELASNVEIDVDAKEFRLVNRFSKFHNLPELTSILSLIADFHPVSSGGCMPKFGGYTDCKTQSTNGIKSYIKDIRRRIERIRSRCVSAKDDNMLKVTADGRKAALDLRLVDPTAKFDPKCKIAQCANKVAEVYHKYYDIGGTQLVFCDSSTPKPSFNAYDELKRLLEALGIPSSEIAYVHDATTEIQREKLFNSMRESKIRILIGSTFKLGIGVNVQDRLIAIHHLDIPWRPADMVQREGRILRPGNQNEEVFIFRYITEGTFDAYSWQLLEIKQRFIGSLLSGSVTKRQNKDIGDTVLSYAEVKALALGNPLIKERVETANEISRLVALQSRNEELRLDMLAQLEELPSYIDKKSEQIAGCEQDIEYYSSNKIDYNREELRTLGKAILEGLSDNEFETAERTVASYQGFDIILPAGMFKSDPFVYVERAGRYKLEYKMTDIGIMIRLNNLLDGLPTHLEKLKTDKRRLEDKRDGLLVEVNNQDNYGAKISSLRDRLAKLDEILGVKYNG